MNNEELIRKLIRGSIQRAIQESAAAVFVLIAFAAILAQRGCVTEILRMLDHSLLVPDSSRSRLVSA
ncbi:MAG: hypothetical protein U0935_19460 [Pirellulales bacterium]